MKEVIRRKSWKMLCSTCERVVTFKTPKGMKPPFQTKDWKDEKGHESNGI